MDDIDVTGSATTTGAAPAGPAEPNDRASTLRRLRRVPPLTAAWWLAGGVTAFAAVLTGRLLPVGASTPDAAGTLVGSVPSDALTAALAILGLVGAGLTAWMASRADRPTTGPARAVAVSLSVLVGAGGVVFTDSSLLARMGYLPLLLVRAPFDPEFAEAFGQYVAPDFVLQLGMLAALILLGVTTVLFVRRSRGACEVCGLRDAPAGHHASAAVRETSATPSGIVAWGRPAAIVAAIIPALYAVPRLLWALGRPIGLDPEMYAEARDDLVAPAIGLGAFALVGAVLTLGLVQRWGEVFPRWIPGLAGRRVPVSLAVVPASLVAVAVLPAGLAMIKGAVDLSAEETLIGWAAFGPGFLWPVWSVALGVATWAYATRRRGACRVCGRTPSSTSTTTPRPAR
jgi:hypothetical protein